MRPRLRTARQLVHAGFFGSIHESEKPSTNRPACSQASKPLRPPMGKTANDRTQAEKEKQWKPSGWSPGSSRLNSFCSVSHLSSTRLTGNGHGLSANQLSIAAWAALLAADGIMPLMNAGIRDTIEPSWWSLTSGYRKRRWAVEETAWRLAFFYAKLFIWT